MNSRLIVLASSVSSIPQSTRNVVKFQAPYLAVKSVPDEIRNAFYSATDDIIKIIGQIVVSIESEDWISESAELFITEGGQRDMITHSLIPSSGIEVRRSQVSQGVNDVVAGHQDQTQTEYLPVQRKHQTYFG